MQEYDAALKRILTRFSPTGAAQLTGFEITHWLNVELPDMRSLRLDLLGETDSGVLVHIELQSTNDARMAHRMLEYAIAVYGVYGRRPEQLVLYTGEPALRMSGHLPAFNFECRIADIRDFDPEPLLASPTLAENMITILMRRRDQRAAVTSLVQRIAAAGPGERADALAELMILAGLRHVAPLVEREIENMPILDDIMDHEVLGPKLRRAMAQGEQRIVMRLMEDRFGAIPVWALNRLNDMNVDQIESVALQVYKAATLEELLAG